MRWEMRDILPHISYLPSPISSPREGCGAGFNAEFAKEVSASRDHENDRFAVCTKRTVPHHFNTKKQRNTKITKEDERLCPQILTVHKSAMPTISMTLPTMILTIDEQ